MTVETLVFLIVLFLVIGALPTWPHSKDWGYQPTGIFTLILVIFLIWALAGGRPLFRSVGDDVKQTGRDAAAAIRETVQ